MSVEAPELVNGQLQTAPGRVKFGPGKTQDVPLPWAEIMLGVIFQAEKDGRKPLPWSTLIAQASREAK